jgi:amino acid adenylation domain-containing protein
VTVSGVNKKIVHTVFEETARRFPERIAIRHGERNISFAELGRAVDALTMVLLQQGVERDVIVGITLESGIEYVAAIIAVMKAGGVFLPVDITLPEKRLEYILAKTPPQVIVADRQFEETGRALAEAGFNLTACPVVLLDPELGVTVRGGESPAETGEAAAAAGLVPEPDDSCYIMYTSGSTGLPKAILGCHKSLSHFVHWEVKEFGLDERVRVTQLPPVTFDASLRDIFVPLITGGTLCIPEKEIKVNAARLIDWLSREGITLVHCVPSLFRLITKELEEREDSGELLPALQYVLMAGEPLYGKDVTRWMDVAGERVGLVNLYGPSETTLIKTFHRIAQRPVSPTAMIPVGQPIANTAILITKGSRLCEVGEIGDIFIKTPFRSKGYYNDPELTRQSFVPNPFTGDANDILYKTGDMGRYLPDRSVEFIGRLDSQVKINGIRIELAEIERTLLASDFLDQAVVLSHKTSGSEQAIVCYYTEKQATDAGAISDWLRLALPSYMVPSYYVRLEEFPLNINGKIDKKALPKPEELIYEGIAYAAPADAEETLLAGIWGEILHMKEVGVNNPFFQIGGHSLTATRVLSRIYRETGLEISLKDFFENQTIRQLAALLRAKRGAGFAAIPVLAPQESYALSHAQQRLWILDRMEEGSVAYSLPGLFLVAGDLDLPALRSAFAGLIERHESLRTTFVETGDGPRQQILDPATAVAKFSIDERDLSGAAGSDALAVDYAREQSAIPFDLSQGPLFRVAVLTLASGRYAIFLNIHHIIGDAWSFDVLANDFWALYAASLAGSENPLPPLALQYRDYAAWQNGLLSSEQMQQSARYWHEKLALTAGSALDLPFDFPRPRVQSYPGATYFFSLDEGLAAGLHGLGRRHEASMFMVLLALVKVLLFRYTGQEDIIVGSPVACRNHPDLDDQIGFFANTLALRDRLAGDDSFAGLLERVKKTTIDGYDHQHYPFDRLVDELGLARDPGRAPLFDVMLVYQEEGGADRASHPVAGSTLRITPLETDPGTSRFDLTFEVMGSAAGLRIGINYNTDLFLPATVERMASHLTVLATAILADAQAAISELELLPSAERHLLLETFNNGQFPYPADKTLVDLFEEQVAVRPDHTALVLDDRQLSYRQLHGRASELAELLIEHYRIRPEQVVGLMVGRNEWSLIGLLGIMMAGGVYLPVDPALPGERISYLLEESGCRLLLTEAGLGRDSGALPASAELVELEELSPPADSRAMGPPLARYATAADPAYVIYTSGSTGVPKGVVIGHSGFINMALQQIRTFGVTPGDRVLQFASPSFDASLSEIFMALLAGAAVVAIKKETIDDPRAFVDYLAAKGVTHVTLPPLYLHALDREALQGVKTIITAGEAPNREDALYLSRGHNYFNAYGPTEISVCATIERVSPEKGYRGKIPIGRPLANTSIAILDAALQLVPIGITGEICIAGAGLAKGYLNRPELTAERFISHPLITGERLYRTGDLGRWLPDGTIELAGRNDDQVKISGYRIELGEIENCLLRHPQIMEAVVIARQRGSGQLAAYFTARETLDPRDLRGYLAGFLPRYMVPHFLLQVDTLPVTVQGKVDREALPDPEGSQAKVAEERATPRNDREREVLSLWQELLGKAGLGIDDNFFEAGGNSLHALQLISRLATGLGVRVPVKTLFLNPTVAALCAAIAATGPPASSPVVTPVAAGQRLSPSLTLESRPLLALYQAGVIAPVEAAAIICLPDWLLDQQVLTREEIITGFCHGQPQLSSIIETFIGRIACIVIPRFAAELFSDQGALEREMLEAMRLAHTLGAKAVSLTGNLPFATGLGQAVATPGAATSTYPAVTTGQATVAAAMVMTVEESLRQAGRQLEQETVGLIGLNTIGFATLSLMLARLPHPQRIILADAYANLAAAAGLSQRLTDGGFTGEIETVQASAGLPLTFFYEASLIIGASNVPGIIDVDQVKPGCIIVTESGQPCLSREHAVQRLEVDGDILFTEGDLLRLPSPASSLLYLPEQLESALRQAEAISHLDFDPRTITGCIFSGLLSHRYVELKPALGEVGIESCWQHDERLRALGFRVEGLCFHGYRIDEKRISRFRGEFGRGDVGVCRTAPEAMDKPEHDKGRA